MEFRVLGPLEVLDGDARLPIAARKQRALLAVLLLSANHTVSRDRIVDDLWGDAVPGSAAKMVQIYVSQLRKVLPEPRLHTRAPGYVLEAGDDEVDLRRYERLLADGRTALSSGRPEAAADLLRRALALWRGPALAEFPEPFARHEGARLEELRVSALEGRIEADLALGRHADVVGELEALISRHPLRETLRSQQMLALYRAGRQAEALASYQAFRRGLADELGIEPTAALKELERRMLRQDADLDPGRPPEAPRPVAVSAPRAGGTDLALLERDDALATLVGAYESAARGEGKIVFVTGEPGIGKTSLVTRFARDLGDGARVLLGTCDDLSTPRPLGPIRDLVGTISPSFEEALASGAAPHELHDLLIAELERPPRPSVLVLEDVHWADEATCDAITVAGRRIGSLAALLVLTFRTGEARPGHPLYAAIGEIRADVAVHVALAPLSQNAVASLAGDDAGEVFAATGGNPFFVTELLASPAGPGLPPSVANSVVARASRLDDDERRLVELVSMVPSRVATSVLDAVMPSWPTAAEEPERRQLLAVEPRWVSFRHELARNAIAASVPIAARRRHHGVIAHALIAANADPANIVHHAEAAGDDDAVAEYSLLAARRAAAVDSNREAYSHYRRASSFIGRLAAVEQATVLEELASAAYTADQLEDALPAIEHAISIYVGLGDEAAVGRCTRVQSRLHWYAGDGEAARRKAVEAVGILEPLGESAELALAYSGVSQLAMLLQDSQTALSWAERALELATRIGDVRTRTHALVNLGGTRIDLDPTDTASLLEAYAVADAAGERHEATRALGNIGYALMCWAQPEPALHFAERALAYAQEHEVHNLASYLATTRAWLLLRRGEWDEAEWITRGELEKSVTVPQLLAKTVLTELAVRRGDPDAAERLADLAVQADRAGELQRIEPVLELEIEWSLTRGGPVPTERLERLLADLPPGGTLEGWGAMRLAAWAAVAGIEIELDQPMSEPHAAMHRRDWRAAAHAFGAIGWPHDRALMLSMLDDEQALGEAAEIARQLGAEPLARRAVERMRTLVAP